MDGGEKALGDGRFGEGQEAGFVEGSSGALGVGVEFADGLDFVAEELEADGAIGFGGVDVEDAAAAGELAGHLDDVGARVADAGEVGEERFDVDLFAATENLREAGVEGRGKELHGGGFDGSDNDGGFAGGDLPEGLGALLLNVGVGGEIFERQDVVGREAQDTVGWDGSGEVATGAEGEMHGVRGLVIGNDDDGWNLSGAREERNVEGAGGRGESRNTPAPSGKRKVPSCLFKGGGILQVRQQLADKGEDHADSSLAAWGAMPGGHADLLVTTGSHVLAGVRVECCGGRKGPSGHDDSEAGLAASIDALFLVLRGALLRAACGCADATGSCSGTASALLRAVEREHFAGRRWTAREAGSERHGGAG